MKKSVLFLLPVILVLTFSTIAPAGDFDWMNQLNITAKADPTVFKARLEARFNIGAARVSAVISNFPNPADAYMVMRLGEMANMPPEKVAEKYKSGKKGWGAFAKSIGIKPGSREFHALKRGHDLDGYAGASQSGKGKGKIKKKDMT